MHHEDAQKIREFPNEIDLGGAGRERVMKVAKAAKAVKVAGGGAVPSSIK